jgi:UPF0716 protein FxsA
MFALLAAALVLFAVVEISVMVFVADSVGVLGTIGLLLLCSIAGAWLAKREGFGVLARIRDRAAMRQPPTNELIDGGLILLAGLLLLIPGFVSDIVGLLLLIPPTRALARGFVKRRFRVRVLGVSTASGYGSYGTYGNYTERDSYQESVRGPDRHDGPDDVIDV